VAPVAPDGVRKGVAIGFGVWISFFLGVTPEKSEGCKSGFSPPNSGVWVSRNRARFCIQRV
jgi:hypothetical protein